MNQKINIAAAKVIKLKLHVSVPGLPVTREKPAPKNPVRKKGQEIWDGSGISRLRPPSGLYRLNRLLKITKSAKAKI